MPLPLIKYELMQTVAGPAGRAHRDVLSRIQVENPHLYAQIIELDPDKHEMTIKGMCAVYYLLATQLDCDELSEGDA